ncbi:hypothetical protein B0T24DRAFT_84653 [Lasiosphaeria ovina]|uniref:Secreted protein n=1 Tax=Lasiosphaeria ovina TaxID=92902 RepID=A0AAE0NN47_9PEZI|nr:hypothetical protein B0T24DRAFT_84653 [Lasiosphaeria ovina]
MSCTYSRFLALLCALRPLILGYAAPDAPRVSDLPILIPQAPALVTALALSRKHRVARKRVLRAVSDLTVQFPVQYPTLSSTLSSIPSSILSSILDCPAQFPRNAAGIFRSQQLRPRQCVGWTAVSTHARPVCILQQPGRDSTETWAAGVFRY